MRWLALLLVLDCGPEPSAEKCPSQRGWYRTVYERIDGDCPDVAAEEALGLNGPVNAPGGYRCTGHHPGPACEAGFDLQCTTTGGAHLTFVGSLRWDGETASGEGTMEIAPHCRGRYAITAHRLAP